MSVMSEDKKLYILYMVTNAVNGKRYVGITSRSTVHRWYRHVAAANDAGGPRGHTVLAQAIRKHGAESFQITKIVGGLSRNQANLMEKVWIVFCGTHCHGGKGYNMTFGGEGWCGKHTDEARTRMSEAAIARMADPSHRHRIGGGMRGLLSTLDGLERLRFSHRTHAKPVRQIDRDGEEVSQFGSAREADRATGACYANIGACCIGKARTAGGFRWEFLEAA